MKSETVNPTPPTMPSPIAARRVRCSMRCSGSDPHDLSDQQTGGNSQGDRRAHSLADDSAAQIDPGIGQRKNGQDDKTADWMQMVLKAGDNGY